MEMEMSVLVKLKFMDLKMGPLSPGNLGEMHILGSHPRLPESATLGMGPSELHFFFFFDGIYIYHIFLNLFFILLYFFVLKFILFLKI